MCLLRELSHAVDMFQPNMVVYNMYGHPHLGSSGGTGYYARGTGGVQPLCAEGGGPPKHRVFML